MFLVVGMLIAYLFELFNVVNTNNVYCCANGLVQCSPLIKAFVSIDAFTKVNRELILLLYDMLCIAPQICT